MFEMIQPLRDTSRQVMLCSVLEKCGGQEGEPMNQKIHFGQFLK